MPKREKNKPAARENSPKKKRERPDWSRQKRPVAWQRLDNAALIFPSASGKSNTYVFRFACSLTPDEGGIDRDILQQALDKTIKAFPIYNSVLKRGLFWYYLEESPLRAVVEEENLPPCSPLFMKEQKTLLYRVSYYKNRINFEMYHVLSDGTGAVQFLKALVSHYLMLKYGVTGEMTLDYDASVEERHDDSFRKYYTGNVKSGAREKKKRIYAYKLKGARHAENRLSVIEGSMPTGKMLELARSFDTTLTVFLASVLILSIARQMPVRARKKPVVLTIPVNLRQYFPSVSARNFFSIIYAGCKIGEELPELPEIIEIVAERFKSELTQEKLLHRLNSLASIEHNVFARIAPLILKDISLYSAHRLARRETTANLSNVGKIDMPDKLAQYIEGFDVFTSTDTLQVCMCSFRDKLTVSFSTEFAGTEIQKSFFRTLSGLGVPVTIAFNETNGG